MNTTKITDQSFDTDVLKSGRPVLVDFWAEWCGPCRQIAPALEDMAGDLKDRLTVAKINIDENPNTPQKYNVRGIPTLMVFKGGQQRTRSAHPIHRQDGGGDTVISQCLNDKGRWINRAAAKRFKPG